MYVHVALLFACWGLLQLNVAAQQKNFKPLTSVDGHAVHNGQVWVKLKDKHRDVFSNSSSGRVAGVNALSVNPFVNSRSRAKAAGRLGPKNQHVDIALYYSVSFDPSKPVDDFIAELYTTGYFEKIEPVYKVEPFVTPNDPSFTQQAYLNLIKAPQAWDITQGDESIVIAVIDTGGDLDHPDLQDKLYLNAADPIDGIDNDNDGFTDNYRGWDFSGADLALIGTPGFIGDNDPSINKANLFAHGTMVAGCAAASTNNALGIASTGYNAKLLFTKHFADNQADVGTGYSSDLYDGILYAATHGAKIINCSWGGYNQSTIAQDIINYVTFDLGCLVVAAAGNSNLENPIYPASYENVLSVGSTDINDVRTYFSNFGKTVDIMATGDAIHTTYYNDAYVTDSGTSLSAPIVSGAAALVWTQNPTFTPLQVAEQLRVSSDASIYDNNPAYLHKLGRGRLDVLAALTVNSPSVRVSNQQLVNTSNTPPQPGQQTHLYFDFTNYLKPSSPSLKATLTSSSPYVTINSNAITLGSMAENSTIRNTSSPFVITLAPSFPIDQAVELLITFEDGTYEDFQLVSLVLPSYVDINENNIITSMTSVARIGWGKTETQSAGSGFIYGEESLLYEMGLIMGTSSSTIINNVRTTGGLFDQDFTVVDLPVKSTPGTRSYSEITGSVRDAANAGDATLELDYQSLVWKDDPYRDFVILEYKVKNTSASTLNGFYFGIFADWDVVNNGAGDRAGWDAPTRLGYVYPAQPAVYPQVGIQSLNGTVQYYAIDNDHTIQGNPFGIYDEFTDVEKYTVISSGLTKTTAGTGPAGNDVSHVVASGPYTIPAGQVVTIAFALHANYSYAGLINSAKYADSVYNYTLKAPVPVVSGLEACDGTSAHVEATGGSAFKWYTEFTGGEPIHEGAVFETDKLTTDTVFYVSNADHSYESIRTKAEVSIVPNPVISIAGTTAFCEGGQVVLSTDVADGYTWSNGEKTQSISATTSGSYSVATQIGLLECVSVTPVEVTVHDTPSAAFTMTPEVPIAGEPVTFVATDDLAVTWSWDFGDGTASDIRDPEHVFEEVENYTVVLSVTSAEECSNSQSMILGPVTAIEDISSGITVYPNPAAGKLFVDVPVATYPSTVRLISVAGEALISMTVTEERTSLDVSRVPDGTYILQVTSPAFVINRKVVIVK